MSKILRLSKIRLLMLGQTNGKDRMAAVGTLPLAQAHVGRYLPVIIANSQNYCRLSLHFLCSLGLPHTLVAETQ